MRTQSPDTSPEAERVLIELLRAAPPWRKLAMVDAANRSVRLLAMAGLKQRHPDECPKLIQRRLAGLLLGEELATLAYGRATEIEQNGQTA